MTNSPLSLLYKTACSLASIAWTLAGVTVIVPEDLKTGSTVNLFIIKDECRWPSPTHVSNPECQISVGKGKVIQGNRGDGYSIIQAESQIPQNARISTG